MYVLTNTCAWAEENFGECDLGDHRRTRRLVKLADGLARHPGGSLLHACGGDLAAVEGTYRLLRNKAITPEAILAGGYLATVRRAHHCEVLLAVEDTTYLSYRHSATEELGDICGQPDAKSKGFVVHSVLLLDGHSGDTVGLVEQQRWTRVAEARGKKHRRKQRAYEEKESFKWQRAGEALRTRLGADLHRRVIAVCDREADITAYLRWQHDVGGRYVVRAAANRVLCSHTEHLLAAMESAPLLGEQSVDVAQRGGRQARQRSRYRRRSHLPAWRCGRAKRRHPTVLNRWSGYF